VPANGLVAVYRFAGIRSRLMRDPVIGAVAIGLVAAFVAPVVLKLNDPALDIIALIGFALMIVDVFQSLRNGDR